MAEPRAQTVQPQPQQVEPSARNASGTEAGSNGVSASLHRFAPLDIISGARPLWEQMLRQAAEAIIVCDAKGRLILVNAAARRLARQEPEGTSLDFAPEAWGQAYENGQRLPIEEYPLARGLRGLTEIGREIRMVHPDGAAYDISISVAPIRDDHQTIVGAIANFIDITARKRTERALYQKTAELQTVLEAVPAMVWVAHDPECRQITGSRTAAEFLRLPADANASLTAPETEKPRHFHVLRQGAELLPHELPVQQAARGIEVQDFEEEVVFDDGMVRYLLGNATPLRGPDGQVTGAVAAFLDITARKRADEALKATLAEKDALLQQKETLLHEVNHRIKNSLQLVSSLLFLQSRRIKDKTAQEQFAAAHSRVLAIAKVHERLYRQTRTPDRIEFGTYLRDLCDDLVGTAFADQKQVRVAVDADQAEMPTDEAVPLALIVNELLTNAFKYAFRGGAGGTIRVAFRAAADGQRSLSVTDDGAGLPPGFDPVKSGGLGMRLVTAFVAQLGAALQVSDAAPGARFAVVLPARAEDGRRETG